MRRAAYTNMNRCTPPFENMKSEELDVEQEVRHVTVFHDVILAFHP